VERLLIIGVIVLPLLIFLILFSDDLMNMTSDTSEIVETEANNLMDLVTE